MVVRLRSPRVPAPLASVAWSDIGFHADDRLDAGFFGLLLEFPRRVQIAVVGDGQGGLFELLGSADQVVYAVRAIEEREFRVTVQMNEGHNRKNSVRSWGLRALAAFVALVVLFLALTPMGRYLTRAGWEEGKILWRRRAITEIVADTT